MIPLNGYTASAYKHNIKVITKTALYTNCANLMWQNEMWVKQN